VCWCLKKKSAFILQIHSTPLNSSGHTPTLAQVTRGTPSTFTPPPEKILIGRLIELTPFSFSFLFFSPLRFFSPAVIQPVYSHYISVATPTPPHPPAGLHHKVDWWHRRSNPASANLEQPLPPPLNPPPPTPPPPPPPTKRCLH